MPTPSLHIPNRQGKLPMLSPCSCEAQTAHASQSLLSRRWMSKSEGKT